MKLRNLLCGLISLGIIIHINGLPSMFWFGDYPYPKES